MPSTGVVSLERHKQSLWDMLHSLGCISVSLIISFHYESYCLTKLSALFILMTGPAKQVDFNSCSARKGGDVVGQRRQEVASEEGGKGQSHQLDDASVARLRRTLLAGGGGYRFP